MPDYKGHSILYELKLRLKKIDVKHEFTYVEGIVDGKSHCHATLQLIESSLTFSGEGKNREFARRPAARLALDWLDLHCPTRGNLGRLQKRLEKDGSPYEVVIVSCPKQPEDQWTLRLFIGAEAVGDGTGVRHHDAMALLVGRGHAWLDRQGTGLKAVLRKSKQERGEYNERRALELLQNPPSPLPGWVSSVRAATKTEDAQGIDLVVSTRDGGQILLQIKSSLQGREEFLRDPRHAFEIHVVVADQEDDDTLFEDLVLTMRAARRLQGQAQRKNEQTSSNLG